MPVIGNPEDLPEDDQDLEEPPAPEPAEEEQPVEDNEEQE